MLCAPGVMHGNVKTSNFIFPAGITEYKDEPAMATDTLCWAGRWYAIGDTHKEFIADKTADEDYLKLTMAAIAKAEQARTDGSAGLAGCRSSPDLGGTAEKQLRSLSDPGAESGIPLQWKRLRRGSRRRGDVCPGLCRRSGSPEGVLRREHTI